MQCDVKLSSLKENAGILNLSPSFLLGFGISHNTLFWNLLLYEFGRLELWAQQGNTTQQQWGSHKARNKSFLPQNVHTIVWS